MSLARKMPPHTNRRFDRKRNRLEAKLSTQAELRETLLAQEQDRLALERELAPIKADREDLLRELREEQVVEDEFHWWVEWQLECERREQLTNAVSDYEEEWFDNSYYD